MGAGKNRAKLRKDIEEYHIAYAIDFENTREAIRNRTVQKALSMSDMILKFFFSALNSKTDCTLQNLPTEIVNKNMERFNLSDTSNRQGHDQIT